MSSALPPTADLGLALAKALRGVGGFEFVSPIRCYGTLICRGADLCRPYGMKIRTDRLARYPIDADSQLSIGRRHP